MTYAWKDKVVLITGAASGIGEFTVRKIMEEGVKHVAVLDIAEAAGKALESELNTKYGAGKVKFYICDVTDEKLLLGIFETVKSDQGYIDVVVNNAGIMNDSLYLYKKAIDINVTALVTGTLKAIEIMGKHNGGRGGAVINISSVAALMQRPSVPIYFGTKSAVLQFSNCIGMKEYYSKYGVRVLAICFGLTATTILNQEVFHFDTELSFSKNVDVWSPQSPLSAAQGLVDAFKLGESGSTWLITRDLPAQDISADVQKAYAILSEKI